MKEKPSSSQNSIRDLSCSMCCSSLQVLLASVNVIDFFIDMAFSDLRGFEEQASDQSPLS